MKYNKHHDLIADLCELLEVSPDELLETAADLQERVYEHDCCPIKSSLIGNLLKDRERLHGICLDLWVAHLRCRDRD
jgi:hypothetical protein